MPKVKDYNQLPFDFNITLNWRIRYAGETLPLVDGVICDFTDSQFAEPIEYENQPASHKEAFAQTN
jgi:hypothetical protein